MKKPLLIILSGLFGGILLAIGFYLATFLDITPFGKAFNDFFTMTGIIIFFISGFFLLSMTTLKK